MMIRVLVADDQALVRGSFRVLVDTAPDLASVGEAATGTEAVEITRRPEPGSPRPPRLTRYPNGNARS